MSAYSDAADAMAAWLKNPANNEPLLVGVEVLVDRQRNPQAQANITVAKKGGTLVTIFWDGFRNEDPKRNKRRRRPNYTIRVWSRPIVEDTKDVGDQRLADDVAEAVDRALHQHQLTGTSHHEDEVLIQGGDFVPHDAYLIYEMDAQLSVSI